MNEKKRLRLDTALLDRGLVESRSRAKALVMAGAVKVNGKLVTKAGTYVREGDELDLNISSNPFVGRGGLKLQHALDHFRISVKNRICIDVGASTGGFTDCLLQHGACHVIAVDVGYGQLDWKLRNHEQVTNMERTNIRNLTRKELPCIPEFGTVDVSFISLRKVLPVLLPLMTEQPELVVLIKPQFEAGPKNIGKGGIVRDPKVREMVVKDLKGFFSDELMLKISGITESPIKGAKGNVEFLCHLSGRR